VKKAQTKVSTPLSATYAIARASTSHKKELPCRKIRQCQRIAYTTRKICTCKSARA
jgi:hypothetical protein